MGNGKTKELICTTHRHELKWQNDGGRRGTGLRGIKGRKNGTTVIAQSIKYIKILKKKRNFEEKKGF